MSSSRGGGKKPLTKYERRAARQRQLEAMEASASGTATSMDLETIDNQGRGSVSMRQRNQETARKFLYDEDEAAGVSTTGPSSSMKNTSSASLFVGRTAAGGRDGMTTVNLMDHETGVYSEEGDRSLTGRIRQFLFGPDLQPQPHHQQATDYHDAIAADTDEVYLGGDTYPRTSRSPSILARLRYLFCHSAQRMLITAIVLVVVAIAVIFTMAQNPSPEPVKMTPEEILRVENTDRYVEIMDHLVGLGMADHESVAEFGSPQSRALRWLAYSDPARLDPNDHLISQRYALAVFFYTTYVHYVLAVGRKGVHLEKNEEDQNIAVPNAGWYNQNNWLSGAGYCSWFGVECEMRRVGNIERRTYDDNGDVYSINLKDNFIYGPLVKEFKAFHSLERLDLSSNSLDGDVTEAVRYLPYVRYLSLDHNKMNSTIPSDIGYLQNVLELRLAHNQFTGSLPTELNRLSNIRILDVSFNKFTGDFPDVKALSNLRTIQLSNNKFDGTVPFSFAFLAQIHEIYMERNNFTGTIAPEFETFQHLQVFSAYENQITGDFPNGLFASNLELRSVMIHKNNLTGSIPIMAGRLQELETLQMHDNMFTGTFPTQWTDMPKLQVLHLQNNKMHGTIPPTIGKLKTLKELWLSNNTLEGSIPPELGECESLESAYFDRNKIQKKVPTELASLTKLHTLRLEVNEIEGPIPDEVCGLKSFEALKFISADCAITCECCNKCY